MTTYQEKGLDALGDPTRREVLRVLRNGPLPVAEIASRFPVSRPAISQHLRVLKEAGLVTDSAVATRRFYALNPDGLMAVRAYFDDFWTTALAEFKSRVESKRGKRRRSA